MRDDIRLSEKESRRVYVVEQLVKGKLSAPQAAEMLSLSVRHVKRLKGAMKEQGAAGLAHKNRGRRPANATTEETRQLIIELATGQCKGSSCQHLAEILASPEYNVKVSAKSIGRILRDSGIPLTHTHKSPRKRRSRPRMPQEGLLVQIDASPFAWLEERGPYMHLHGAIDDATSKVLALRFRLQEDSVGYRQILMDMLAKHGTPQCVYSDRHTIFVVPEKYSPSIEEQLQGAQLPLSQFGRTLNELGINHITAGSPQAKGRIERLWGTLQHRLVVEMRLHGICTLEAANEFLPGFIERFNDHFAVPAKDSELAYRPCPDTDTLALALATREKRSASSGSTISYHGTTYQLINAQGRSVPLKPRKTIWVLNCFDGTLKALCDDIPYHLKALPAAPSANPAPPRSASEPVSDQNPDRKKRSTPAPNHPWRSSYKTISQQYREVTESLSR